MNIEIVTFTTKGYELGNQLVAYLEDSGDNAGCTACFGGSHIPLKTWTEQAFQDADALIFIGATGIAVRAISSFIQHKAQDPAVISMDETGKYVIPLLSGHLGGANEFSLRLAHFLDAIPVITTATDLNGVWAVDNWAKRNGCTIINPGRIKTISGRLLDRQKVLLYSDIPICGQIPDGVILTEDKRQADILVSCRCLPWTLESPLLVCPKACVLGMGCRKNTSAETIRGAVQNVLRDLNMPFSALCCISSIDLKAQEAGLLDFADHLGLSICFFSAEELNSINGLFEESPFVEQITGVGNVCERAAAAACGDEYTCLIPKTICDGVTVSIYQKHVHLQF